MMKTYPGVIYEDSIKYEFIFFDTEKTFTRKNA